VKCRFLVGMDIPLPLPGHATEFGLSCIPFGLVLIRIVFGLEDDCPSSGKDTAMQVELIGFEEEATKDWQHGQVLSIGKVHDAGRWRHLA